MQISDIKIEPWTLKKIALQGQGFKPWTYQKDCDARPGVRTLDLQKKIVCTIVHAIANTIAHTIMKINMRTECTNEFHVEHGWWSTDNTRLMDDSQTDQKTDNGQTVQK